MRGLRVSHNAQTPNPAKTIANAVRAHAHGAKPLFMSLHFNAPHWPWQVPGDAAYPDTMDWKNGGSPMAYGKMMKSLDDAVGRIMQVLKDQHLEKNTLVILTLN